MTVASGKVALLWHGDVEARRTATPDTSRFARIFAALAARGIQAEPAVYTDDLAETVRRQLLGVDGVLVWVNPLSDGQDRTHLDALLRDVAASGRWVSAHPDVILKMGVKAVLHRTRHLGWGVDTRFYRTTGAFRAEFPACLRAIGPRVLKRNRGNGGQGVWRVELIAPATVRVLHALRGSVPEDVALADFMARCDSYVASDGGIIDQPFQPRLPDGMIRCYMGADRVVGFGHQLIKALVPPPPEGPDAPSAQPGPRIMQGADAPPFQRLRRLMEAEWTPQMADLLGIATRDLPIIWDADFLYGPRTPAGEDTYVLCEINVSSVFPIPDQAPEAIARLVEVRLGVP
jgi:hypothetical protein